MIEELGSRRTIPLQPEKYEDDIDNAGKFNLIRRVRGLGRTKKEALERMLGNARNLGADIIYEFRHHNQPDKYWPEVCEGQAYRRNSSEPTPEPRPAA